MPGPLAAADETAASWGVDTTGPWRIALVSASVLVLELALIRLIPAEVRVISYFTNLVLMACFFGLGLGCILARWRPLATTVPLGVMLILAFVVAGRGVIVYSEATDVHYWLLYSEMPNQARRLPLLPAAFAAFLLAACPFVGLGQTLARAMDRLPRLRAYGWDIAGSLAGTVVFTAGSFLGVPPWLWVAAVLGAWAAAMVRTLPRRALWLAAGVAALALGSDTHNVRWSPYYLVQWEQEATGLRVWVNSSLHQYAVDWTATGPEARDLQRHMLEKWSQPYKLYRELHQGAGPRRVLVLGAGTGNDLTVALANGAEEVVAVEIDPVILELGQLVNPARPYQDRRVEAVVGDARAFLKQTDRRFDLVVFGTLDSQALLSGLSSVRLENFVYTREGLADARRVLTDDGLVAVYYAVFRPWLYGRILATVEAVFGDAVRLYPTESRFLFNTVVVAGPGVERLPQAGGELATGEPGTPSTDDWPFVYLERRAVGREHLSLVGLVAVLVLGVLFLLRRLHPATGLHADYLLLGLGFTLMESSAVVRMALLFGSTWTVNAVVFAAVLLTIFVANWSVLRRWAPPLAFAWPTLLALILLNAVFPLAALFALPLPLRATAAAVLVGAPVYCAATCFSTLFAREPTTGYALGVNLVGAMAGGLIEYASMALGMRAIWLIALGLYALAWLSSVLIGRRRLPDAPPRLA